MSKQFSAKKKKIQKLQDKQTKILSALSPDHVQKYGTIKVVNGNPKDVPEQDIVITMLESNIRVASKAKDAARTNQIKEDEALNAPAFNDDGLVDADGNYAGPFCA